MLILESIGPTLKPPLAPYLYPFFAPQQCNLTAFIKELTLRIIILLPSQIDFFLLIPTLFSQMMRSNKKKVFQSDESTLKVLQSLIEI